MPRRRPAFDPNKVTAPPESAPPSKQLWTVSGLNGLIKQAITERLPTTIHLAGEISNLSQPTSGHLYLTLKDENGIIRPKSGIWINDEYDRQEAEKIADKTGMTVVEVELNEI